MVVSDLQEGWGQGGLCFLQPRPVRQGVGSWASVSCLTRRMKGALVTHLAFAVLNRLLRAMWKVPMDFGRTWRGVPITHKPLFPTQSPCERRRGTARSQNYGAGILSQVMGRIPQAPISQAQSLPFPCGAGWAQNPPRPRSWYSTDNPGHSGNPWVMMTPFKTYITEIFYVCVGKLENQENQSQETLKIPIIPLHYDPTLHHSCFDVFLSSMHYIYLYMHIRNYFHKNEFILQSIILNFPLVFLESPNTLQKIQTT